MPERPRARGLWTYFWLAALFQYVPLWFLVMLSFNDARGLGLPFQGFTLRFYREISESATLLASFWTSVYVALVSSLLAVLLGTAAAIAITRTRFRGRTLFTVATMVPLVVPAIALGVALLVTLVAFGIPLGRPTVIVGHTIKALPYVALLVAVRFAGLNKNLEEAAMDLGATRWRVMLRIYLPMAGPAVVPAFLFALVLSFDDFDLSYFLSGSDQTLPVYFFSGLRRPALLPPVVALQSVVVMATTAGLVAWELFRQRAARRTVRQVEVQTS